MQRNDKIFRHINPSFIYWEVLLKRDVLYYNTESSSNSSKVFKTGEKLTFSFLIGYHDVS